MQSLLSGFVTVTGTVSVYDTRAPGRKTISWLAQQIQLVLLAEFELAGSAAESKTLSSPAPEIQQRFVEARRNSLMIC